MTGSADLTTLTFLLGRLGRLNEALVTEVCADHGTTPAEVRVLSMLAHQSTGAASPRHVARFVVQTTGGLTATLGRLESAGLVERRPDPTDGRGRLVALTTEGREFQSAVMTAVVQRTAAVLDDLDLDRLDHAVRAAVVAFETAAGLPSSAGFVAGVPTVLDPSLDPTGSAA